MIEQFVLPSVAPVSPRTEEASCSRQNALLARLRNHDEAAFAELVDSEGSALLRVAWRLIGQQTDAEDLVQEAFLRFHRCLPTFRGEAAISTWLYRTVTRLAIDHLRRQRLRRAIFFFHDTDNEAPDPLAQIADPSATPFQQLEQQQLARHLTNTLRRLPSRQQTVFVLRHYEGLPLAEIAQLLGTREGTVKSHLHRALAALRRALASYQGE